MAFFAIRRFGQTEHRVLHAMTISFERPIENVGNNKKLGPGVGRVTSSQMSVPRGRALLL